MISVAGHLLSTFFEWRDPKEVRSIFRPQNVGLCFKWPHCLPNFKARRNSKTREEVGIGTVLSPSGAAYVMGARQRLGITVS